MKTKIKERNQVCQMKKNEKKEILINLNLQNINNLPKLQLLIEWNKMTNNVILTGFKITVNYVLIVKITEYQVKPGHQIYRMV